MKKVILQIVLLTTAIIIVSAGFSSAQVLNASINNNTAYMNRFFVYNITVNNTASTSSINFTQVNVSVLLNLVYFADLPFGTSTTGNLSANVTQTAPYWVTYSWTNKTPGYEVVPNGTVGYFWANLSFFNKTGNFNITVTTLDDKGNINTTNITMSLQDKTAPKIKFSSPTPSNNSNVSTPYFIAKITATDYNLSSIKIYLYNSTDLVNSATNQTIYKSGSTLSVNFTGLLNGTYYVNATANDSSNNFNVTLLRYININTSLASSQCVPDWSCGNWSVCSNTTSKQTRVCVDNNDCNNFTDEPNTTKSCTPSSAPTCTTNWNCTWVPSCTSNNQTQYYYCIDLNGCKQPYNETQRQCSVTSSTENKGGTNVGKIGFNTGSWTFFLVIAIVAIAVVGVIVVLMRIKKNPSDDSDIYTPNPSPSKPGIPPRRGPPGNSPAGSPMSRMPQRMMPRRNFQQRPQKQRRMPPPRGNPGNFKGFQTY